MPKTNPGKETLLSFLEEVEKDKLANQKDNAKQLGEACKARDIPDDSKEMNEASFSRQHYQAIADILKEVYRNNEEEPVTKTIITDIGTKLIELFKKDNPRFDETRFRNAVSV